MRKLLLPCLIFLCIGAHSQTFYFPASEHADSAGLSKSIPALAKKIIAVYKEENRQTYFDNSFRLQIVTGEYERSIASLDSLIEVMGDDESQQAIGIQYRAYAQTKLNQPSEQKFAEEFKRVLNRFYAVLPEKSTATAAYYFNTDFRTLSLQLAGLIDKHAGKDSISLADAILFCRTYNSYTVYEKILAPGKELMASVENSQFIIEDSVRIRTRDGATISATVIRKKDITTPMPVLFVFNIYTGWYDKFKAREAATRGYVGVVANTRGKRLSPEEIEPFEYDARDAYDIVDWISKQPWCNGKVGMYGGSYLGFAQWATAKKVHPALKTIVPQVAVGIGIDYPMYNNVFMSYMLQWIHYVSNSKESDELDFGNAAHWDSVYRSWYTSGRSFRFLDTLEGRPNKIFQRWLQHPGHDSYWQNMVAYQNDFSKINIPVLTITGYYDDDQPGALYYFNQHYLHNKNANHYLLIGPYDHYGAQSSPSPTLDNYKVDSVALINVIDIVYQWFDHILKDKAKPAILKDKINMQVMGANEWRNLPSISKIANDTLTLYFSNIRSGNYYKLLTKKPVVNEFIRQEFDYQYRGDSVRKSYHIVDSLLPVGERLSFISEPFDKPVIITGSVIGEIKAAVNKKDFDYIIRVYEQMPDGKYLDLSTVLGRASFAKDRSKRVLLRPGATETIPFDESIFTCRQFQKGSRLVILLGINKSQNWQINYGTGKDVSDETIEDGKIPLNIQWFNSSFIQFPVWK